MACKEGGEHSLELVDSNGTSMQLCTKCGRIMEHSTFAEKNATEPGTSYAPLSQGQKPDLSRMLRCHVSRGVSKPAGLVYGLSIIKDIGNLLKLSIMLIEDACRFYTEVYYKDRYNKLELRNKKKLAACCLYIKCRQKLIPLTMKQMCHMIQEMPKEFGHYFNDIVVHFHLTVPPFEFELFVPSFCAKAQLSERITKRVEDMVSFLDMTGHKTGCSYQNIVAASAFLAWQADDVTKNGRVILKKDSNDPDLKVLKEFASHAVRKHVKLVLEDFKKLAAELPWLRARKKKLTNYTVLFHVDDVLKYRQSLFLKHMAKCDEMEKQFRWEISDETIPVKSRVLNKSIKIRKPVAAAGSQNQVNIQWLGSVIDSDSETQVPPRKSEVGRTPRSVMTEDLNWIGSILNSEVTAEKSRDDDSMENEPSCKGNEKNSSVTDINIDTASTTDTKSDTDTLDHVISNRHAYTAAVATIDHTSEGDLYLRLPASNEFQTVELECGDHPKKVESHPKRVGVFRNVIESCASRCDGNNLPIRVADAVCSAAAGDNNETTEIKTKREQAALHSANLDRVKRKYSRCIGPRSFKRARILEAEKAAIQDDPVEKVVDLESIDNCEIDDSEISDSEIDQYLRSPQEITTLMALHKKGAIVYEIMDN
ncbi:uncharacterized protein LOC135489709 [Lineus longissimus]|uniref:uncharacterized protein LOC135489709 n=1 Tax=Lineus longissimus TaxID=88925 RepID=UPI002B4EFBD5